MVRLKHIYPGWLPNMCTHLIVSNKQIQTYITKQTGSLDTFQVQDLDLTQFTYIRLTLLYKLILRKLAIGLLISYFYFYTKIP